MNRRGWALLLALGASALLLLLLLALQGVPPDLAAAEILRGAFGSASAWSATLRRFVPLALCGLAVLLAFRAGLWNIGAEGQRLVGALAGAFLALRLGHWLPALLLGAAAGAAWALLAGWLRRYRHVPEVLTTIMLNFVALETLRFLVTGPLQERTGQFPQTDALPPTAWLPESGGGAWPTLHLGLWLALALTLLTWPLLFRTRFGVLLRASAQTPRLVQGSGFSLARTELGVWALSGALAGLSGAVEVTGVDRLVDHSLAQGTGYAAIAVALLARLEPWAVLPSALLFAALEEGTSSLQWVVDQPGLDRFALVVQGVLILTLLWHGRAAAVRGAAHG